MGHQDWEFTDECAASTPCLPRDHTAISSVFAAVQYRETTRAVDGFPWWAAFLLVSLVRISSWQQFKIAPTDQQIVFQSLMLLLILFSLTPQSETSFPWCWPFVYLIGLFTSVHSRCHWQIGPDAGKMFSRNDIRSEHEKWMSIPVCIFAINILKYKFTCCVCEGGENFNKKAPSPARKTTGRFVPKDTAVHSLWD